MNRSWLSGTVLAVLALGAAGCSTVPPQGPLSHPDDREVIHEEELLPHERLDAFQVVQRLKPRWLRPRGQQALTGSNREGVRVYLDGMLRGDVSALRRVPAHTVGEIRFLDSRQATLRFGTGHAEGAILVATRRGVDTGR